MSQLRCESADCCLAAAGLQLILWRRRTHVVRTSMVVNKYGSGEDDGTIVQPRPPKPDEDQKDSCPPHTPHKQWRQLHNKSMSSI